ncbi:MAG TPA: molybdopterin converting factor subunit 1 [Pirellulales bacterium]|jgi:molybdopterin converting factor subunit 1
MQHQVQLFAAAKQWAGTAMLELELPASATVGELRQALIARIPQIASFGQHLRLAINSQYADDSMRLPENAEIACIPPVSGG